MIYRITKRKYEKIIDYALKTAKSIENAERRYATQERLIISMATRHKKAVFYIPRVFRILYSKNNSKIGVVESETIKATRAEYKSGMLNIEKNQIIALIW